MLRPYCTIPVPSGPGLESFCQAEPHHPVLAWPVERMDDVHLPDRVTEQIHAERDAGAPHDLARAVAENVGAAVRRPGDTGIVEDAGLDRQDPVVAAATQQPERREA